LHQGSDLIETGPLLFPAGHARAVAMPFAGEQPGSGAGRRPDARAKHLRLRQSFGRKAVSVTVVW